jgi:hypothetical protein
MTIVLAEERARGFEAAAVPSVRLEKEYGCDILSTPPSGREPHRVEVKGWGEPLLRARGGWSYDQDIRPSQYAAASTFPTYRLEIVANIEAWLAGIGELERLTLTAKHIVENAYISQYRVPLELLRGEVTIVDAELLADVVASDPELVARAHAGS